MDFSKIKLYSSNEKKLQEYRDMGIPIEILKGVDLPEVNGTPEEVIVYKSMMAGPNSLVEDSILLIEGEPVIDIKWKIADLVNTADKHAEFLVNLAVNDGVDIFLWKGVVVGKLISPDVLPKEYFGFDPFFVPENSNDQSLHALRHIGKKEDFSPRVLALKSFLSEKPYFCEKIQNIPEWTGDWQNTPTLKIR